MDKVSIVIGTYNRYDLCLRAVNSALNQTYPNIEVILVDDNSNDVRYENFKNFNGIKYIKLDNNTSIPAGPRNVGIKESTGDWISFLDDDDFFLPNKIEEQMKLSKEYDFICCDAFANDINTIKYAKGIYIGVWECFNSNDTNLLDFEIINKHNLIINSSVLVKKQLLENINYITEDTNYRYVEDYITWKKLLETETKYCYFVDNPLVVYRMK